MKRVERSSRSICLGTLFFVQIAQTCDLHKRFSPSSWTATPCSSTDQCTEHGTASCPPHSSAERGPGDHTQFHLRRKPGLKVHIHSHRHRDHGVVHRGEDPPATANKRNVSFRYQWQKKRWWGRVRARKASGGRAPPAVWSTPCTAAPSIQYAPPAPASLKMSLRQPPRE